jgi:hypothetical protein
MMDFNGTQQCGKSTRFIKTYSGKICVDIKMYNQQNTLETNFYLEKERRKNVKSQVELNQV